MIQFKHIILICGYTFLMGSMCTAIYGCKDDVVNTSDGNGETEQPEEVSPEFIEACETIMERVKQNNMGSPNADGNVEEYLGKIQENGSFPDIDYKDTSFSWKPVEHLNRMKKMAQAYILAESKYFENADLQKAIVKALEYWNTVHPVCDNWYNNQIRAPKMMGEILIILRYGKERVPEELETSICKYWEETGGNPAEQPLGSNKSDIALHWLYRGILTTSPKVVDTAIFHSYRSLDIVNPGEEGIQNDMSLHQHGPQLYIGGYGEELLKGVTQTAIFTAGTSYDMTRAQRNTLHRFVNETFMESIRGQYQFYNVVGRSVSREPQKKVSSLNRSSFKTILERMKSIDHENVADYEHNIAILNGEGYSGIEKKLRYYYVADYMSVQDTKYSIGLRMSSKRTSKIENGNGENIKGFFMSDGSMNIAVSGEEYTDIFPVWDWWRVPGVTNPYNVAIPDPAKWTWGNRHGDSDFTGGLTDGKDGLAAFHMIYDSFDMDMSAKKSYFFVDDKVVCLGSDIKSSMNQSINTTVDQSISYYSEPILYSENNSKQELTGTVKQMNKDIDWLWHRDIGYFFPGKEVVSVKRGTQKGKWSDINTGGSTKEESKTVFSVWFDHGARPSTKNTYCYIIVPGIDKNQMESYNTGVEIASNTADIQSVAKTDGSLIQAVFYKDGTLSVKNNLKISTDRACALMVRKAGENNFNVYFSDPSHKLKTLTITIEYNGVKKSYTHNSFNGDNIYKGITHNTQISF